MSEYGTMSNNPAVKAITRSIHEMGSALKDIKIQSLASLRKRGFVWRDNLPQVTYMPLNTAPTVTKGKPSAIADQVYVVGNQFQIDEFYVDEVNAVENPLDSFIKIWLEAAFVYDFNFKFINNDHSSISPNDTNAWVGLRGRLGPVSGQVAGTNRYNVNTEMIFNGGLELFPTSITAATAEKVIVQIQQVLDYMGAPTGEGCTLYCNDYEKRGIEASIRAMGAGAGFDITKDAYDRSVEKYKDLTIRDLGRQAPQSGGIQTGRIVPADEDANGNSAGTGTLNYGSLYFVRHGEDYFSGWQIRPLKPKYLGLDPTNGTVYNVVIRWALGLWQQHSRAIARVYNCNLAS